MEAALEAGWCQSGRGLVIKVMFGSVSSVPPRLGLYRSSLTRLLHAQIGYQKNV